MIIVDLFHTILTEPLFNALVFLYNTVAFQDFGIAILLLTLIIRFALWPLSQKALRAQKELQKIQPKIKKTKEKYEDDKEKQAKELMAVYKEHKVNPFGGCLPILVQLPILLALYSVFLNGLDPAYLSNLYSFIASPGTINSSFLGLIDLSSRSILLAFIVGGLQFIQSKMMLGKKSMGGGKGGDIAKMMSKQTMYVLPVITIVISWRLPAGLPLYWGMSTLFTVFQQFVIMGEQNPEEKPYKEGSKDGAE